MTGLFYLTFLVMVQCGHASGGLISQLDSTVKVQPGHSINLKCHILLTGHFYLFWIKIPLNEAPVCVATAKSLKNEAALGEQFEHHSRIKVTWNQKTFNLSFSSVEQADVATYVCGLFTYEKLFWGNGSKLMLEELSEVSPNTTAKDKEKIDGKRLQFEYLVPALATTNVASILFIILLIHLLRKKRSSVTREVGSASDTKTDEVNYAALNFGNKERRTVQKRTKVATTVVYGAVRHQEAL
ncbi:uncharacterized protein LOC108436116 isoform X2 [Pygocentrus nattereri]|uniref:uncharacterized protein LOC108436116 isoform X2 n=1 Tax=Pygocentrus nattereri TaxID=42514 RepID=UPI0008147F06|nr:uncharacterized protein LOC108436116 isoform X2 [Pygocentrus nattereri]